MTAVGEDAAAVVGAVVGAGVATGAATVGAGVATVVGAGVATGAATVGDGVAASVGAEVAAGDALVATVGEGVAAVVAALVATGTEVGGTATPGAEALWVATGVRARAGLGAEAPEQGVVPLNLQQSSGEIQVSVSEPVQHLPSPSQVISYDWVPLLVTTDTSSALMTKKRNTE